MSIYVYVCLLHPMKCPGPFVSLWIDILNIMLGVSLGLFIIFVYAMIWLNNKLFEWSQCGNVIAISNVWFGAYSIRPDLYILYTYVDLLHDFVDILHRFWLSKCQCRFQIIVHILIYWISFYGHHKLCRKLFDPMQISYVTLKCVMSHCFMYIIKRKWNKY